MLVAICTCLAVAAAEPAPAQQVTRRLRLHVTDTAGKAVHDLASHELVVLENGVARPVLRLTKDTRPLAIALVVDSSVAMQSELPLNLRSALTAFLARLPEDTRVALWTSGARPTRRVDWTTDVRAVERAVAHIMPEGGNVLIDTIDEAIDAIVAAEGRHMALVIVTGNGVELSSRDEALALERRERRADTEVHSIQIDVTTPLDESTQGEADESPRAQRLRSERTLVGLAAQTGGRYEHLLSAMSAEPALAKIATDLAEAYFLTYTATAGLNQPKIKVLVSRPKVQVRHVPAPEVQ